MCLVALAIDTHRRFPLVIAANRDEFFARPAARLAWWTPDRGGPAILAGRDLQSGGTWLGLTAEGRLALLTNVRDPAHNDPDAPSRGAIVPDWLSGRDRTDHFWVRSALSGYNGFNLVGFDFRQGESFWASNHGHSLPHTLGRGVHGVSNAGLDTPWPKVENLKARLAQALTTADSVDALSVQLFDALADRRETPDEALPQTGISLEWERHLSAAFVRVPDGGYGTRCSTLVITEKVGRRLVTHVLERSFSPAGAAVLRRTLLRDWPPRYSTGATPHVPSRQEEVADAQLPEVAAASPAPQRRVRSLLKPDPSRKRRRQPASGNSY
jgi:uncharacterized protein with NRDE domain